MTDTTTLALAPAFLAGGALVAIHFGCLWQFDPIFGFEALSHDGKAAARQNPSLSRGARPGHNPPFMACPCA